MTRHALLVATASYSDAAFHRLRSPTGDARRLARVLRDAGGFDEVTLLEDRPRPVIEEHIEELFADRRYSDLALLYLSCHGVRDQSGRLYFATPETKRLRLASSAVSSWFLHERVEQSRAGAKVVLLDCCFSGAFVAGFRPKSQRDDAGVEQLAGRGYVVMTSSDALEYAFEEDGDLAWSEGSTSLFTDAVIAGLTSPDADLDGDGWISTVELADYVFTAVRARGASQTPQHHANGLDGRILLAHVAAPAPQLIVQPDRLDFGRLAQGQGIVGRVRVRNGGSSDLAPVLKTSAAWLQARLDGEEIVVAVDAATPGLLSGQLIVASRGGDTVIPVTAYVDPLVPRLVVEPERLDFGRVTPGQRAVRRLLARNVGGGELDLQVKASAPWIGVHVVGEEILVALDTNSPGVRNGQLIVLSQGGDAVVPVTARVDAGQQKSKKPDTTDSSRRSRNRANGKKSKFGDGGALGSMLVLAVLGLLAYRLSTPGTVTVLGGGVVMSMLLGLTIGSSTKAVLHSSNDAHAPDYLSIAGLVGAVLGALLVTNVLRLASISEPFDLVLWLASILGSVIVVILYRIGNAIFRAFRRIRRRS